MGDNLIEPSGVAIARGDVTLGGGVVAISPPGGDESSEVAVVFVEWHTVITVPAIALFSSCCVAQSVLGGTGSGCDVFHMLHEG